MRPSYGPDPAAGWASTHGARTAHPGTRANFARMRIRKHYVALDAANVRDEAEFWAAVFGGEVRGGDTWLDVVVAGETVVAIQDAPDHVAPEWPSNDPARQQQQAHLDLYVDSGEVEAAEADVISLGARLLDDRYDVTALEGFRVYADPAGHPFCICW